MREDLTDNRKWDIHVWIIQNYDPHSDIVKLLINEGLVGLKARFPQVLIEAFEEVEAEVAQLAKSEQSEQSKQK
jgi:hypothetical protein